MTTLLKVEDVRGGYGATEVLKGMTLSVEVGARVGLCGPNGHGKSTLMRTVSQLQPAWGGCIEFEGTDLSRVSGHRVSELGLVYVPQGNRLFPRLTVKENLYLGAYNKNARPRESSNLEQALSLFPRLKERLNQRCRTLSGGERQMLAIAVGLMASPKLLILDEPNLGLAPIVKEELGSAIKQIAKEDITLVVIEEDIEFLAKLVERLHVVNDGKITFSADTAGGIDQHEIIRRYFSG